jgi:hypothetical protein
MISRANVEKVLKVNGVTPEDADEGVIRSVLLNARYNDHEVDTALMVLRENPKTQQSSVEGLHKVFRTDRGLSPDEISSLLGIQIDASDMPTRVDKNREISSLQVSFIWALSVIAAAAGMLFYMYFYEIGPFHPVAGVVKFNAV